MNRTFTMSLAAVVLALGVYIGFYERHTLSTSELSERKQRLIPEFIRDRVTEIGIVRDNENIVIERANTATETWNIRGPFSARTDESAIEALLSALEWTDSLRTIRPISEKQRAQYGLTKPRVRAWFTVTNQRIPITFGNKDIVEDGIYVQLQATDRVFVAPKDFLEAFDHPAIHFRLRTDAAHPKN